MYVFESGDGLLAAGGVPVPLPSGPGRLMAISVYNSGMRILFREGDRSPMRDKAVSDLRPGDVVYLCPCRHNSATVSSVDPIDEETLSR